MDYKQNAKLYIPISVTFYCKKKKKQERKNGQFFMKRSNAPKKCKLTQFHAIWAQIQVLIY